MESSWKFGTKSKWKNQVLQQQLLRTSLWSPFYNKGDLKNFMKTVLLLMVLNSLTYSLVKLHYFQFAARELRISVGNLPEIEECLCWQLQRSAIHSKYKFCFLSQSSKCQSIVIKLLYNLWSNLPDNKNCFLQTKHSHDNVCKVSLLRNLFFGHMRFDFICWWNNIINFFQRYSLK